MKPKRQPKKGARKNPRQRPPPRAGKRPPAVDAPFPIVDPPAVGAEMELTVEEFAPTGDAVARIGGYVVFLRNGVPGERVRVRIVQAKKRFGRAEVLEVSTPAPARVTPRCRHFGECGRCAFQHLEYQAQLDLKTQTVADVLQRALPNVRVDVRPMRGLRNPWGFRNKAHFAFTLANGEATLGHFRPHETTVLPIVECPVHHPGANAAAFATMDAVRRHKLPVYRDDSKRGAARHVVVRASQASGDALALLVAASERLDHAAKFGPRVAESAPNVVGVHRLINAAPGPMVIAGRPEKLWGADRLTETLGGVEFHLGPTTFFQTNVQAAEMLLEIVLAHVPLETSRVLDLYCGAGLFALPLAKRGAFVVGVEFAKDAVADAKYSAEANGLAERCRFMACAAEVAFDRLAVDGPFEAVVLDPPREGCSELVLERLVRQIRPPVVVAVSCEPQSLGREAAYLIRHGYRLRFVQPVDMFPHTAQIEAVAVFDLKMSGKFNERRIR